MEITPSLFAQNGNRRAYVLDTNVLLHDPASMFRFEEHIVVIPMLALEEIDAKKHDPVLGFNAREISQKLEILLRKGYGEEGLQIPNGKDGTLFFLTSQLAGPFPRDIEPNHKDNLMLWQVMSLQRRFPTKEFIFVTKDRNLRNKSRIVGVKTEDYRHDKISEEFLNSLFSPLHEVILSEEEVNEIFRDKSPDTWGLAYQRKWRLLENEGIVLLDSKGKFFGLGIRKDNQVKYLDYKGIKVLGSPPKVLDEARYEYNHEQAICMHQALDDSIKVQVIIGKAGTGKTYIAMAAALQKVLKETRYESIKLVKPVITKSRLGEDIGFLPGSVKRKLIPKMRPFIEKLRLFTGDDRPEPDAGYHKLIESGVIELVNLADVRGADLSGSIVIFDEAQNANPFQMRTLGTRLGDDTKLIVLGDPTQIDNIYLDKYSNALINLYLNSFHHPEPFIGRIYLHQMVRSHTSKWFEEVIEPGEEREKTQNGSRQKNGEKAGAVSG
jgi:PhoH-like ATPase